MFDYMVDITRAHAREAVQRHRETAEYVYLVWVGQAVLGVYSSQDRADDVAALFPGPSEAKVERRLVG